MGAIPLPLPLIHNASPCIRRISRLYTVIDNPFQVLYTMAEVSARGLQVPVLVPKRYHGIHVEF